MAAAYRLGAARRIVNVVVRLLAALGLAGRHTYVLRVRGRRSGRRYSTPVRLVESEAGRWLVAPYGERSWVRNARAAGRVELRRAGRTEEARIEELAPAAAAPVLREYYRSVPVTRPFFDVALDSRDEEWIAEAPRHPVFRLGQPA